MVSVPIIASKADIRNPLRYLLMNAVASRPVVQIKLLPAATLITESLPASYQKQKFYFTTHLHSIQYYLK